MDAANFVVTVILVTASGALAPGPLFVVALSQGSRVGAKGGLTLSVAHTIVEFSLVMLLAVGLTAVIPLHAARLTIGVVGGVVLLVYGAKQILNSLSHTFAVEPKETGMRSLLLSGLAFSGLNPFFIIWWLTAGANLIILSYEFASFLGVLFMYVCHVWMDYLWLVAVAHFAKAGVDVMGVRWYKILILVLGAILVFYGLYFIVSSL